MGWEPRFPGNLFLVFQQGLVDGHVSVGAVDIPILLRAVSGLGVLLHQSTLTQFIKTLEADNVTNPFDVYCAAVWCYNAVCEQRSYSDWAALLQTCLERTQSLSQWGSVSGPGFLRFLDALFFTPTVVAKQLRQHGHGQMCKAVRERVDLCLSQCTADRGCDIIQLKVTTDVVFRIRQGDLVVAASLLGWVHASTHDTIKLSLSDPQNALVGHIISFRDAVVSSRGQDQSFESFCHRVCSNEWYDTLIRHDVMVTKRLYFHALEERARAREDATRREQERVDSAAGCTFDKDFQEALAQAAGQVYARQEPHGYQAGKEDAEEEEEEEAEEFITNKHWHRAGGPASAALEGTKRAAPAAAAGGSGSSKRRRRREADTAEEGDKDKGKARRKNPGGSDNVLQKAARKPRLSRAERDEQKAIALVAAAEAEAGKEAARRASQTVQASDHRFETDRTTLAKHHPRFENDSW
jgi:hypothetical protein